VKYYLFHLSEPLNQEEFKGYLLSIDSQIKSVKFNSKLDGYFIGNSELSTTLNFIAEAITGDFNVSISILSSYELNDLSSYLFRHCTKKERASYKSLADTILDLILKNDYSFLPFLTNIFKDVNDSILLSIETYVRTGFNATLTAKKLFIHRNSFYYRMNDFFSKTRIDIHDYENSQLVMFYIKLKNME